MGKAQLSLGSAPIVEAIVDVDCDMPAVVDIEELDAAARAALVDHYPTARRRVMNEHLISATPDAPLAVTSRQALQSLQYFAADERQLVQFRPAGFSFNRLAPYTTLDEYLPEIERTWRLFASIAAPLVCRVVRLRFINRILLPMNGGRVNLDDYLRLAPRLVDEDRFTFVGFLNQHSMVEPATGNQVNIVFATQPPEDQRLPVIFDIEAFKLVATEPSDWPAISGTIDSLRVVKNLVFANSLTEKCLNLFRPSA